MDHHELQDALEWLRRATSVAETALRTELVPEVRQEWVLALERKQVLLRDLEGLNARLLAAQTSTVDADSLWSG